MARSPRSNGVLPGREVQPLDPQVLAGCGEHSLVPHCVLSPHVGGTDLRLWAHPYADLLSFGFEADLHRALQSIRRGDKQVVWGITGISS